MTVRGTAAKTSRPGSDGPPVLQDTILRLRQIGSAVAVAVAALRQQNCELDADVAQLLQFAVADCIAEQIARLRRARAP